MSKEARPERNRAELAALAKAAAELIEQGLTLPEVAARRGMPSLDTLRRWLSKVNNLRARYDDAAALRAEVMADVVVAIADAAAGESLAGAKLRMDARKWRVALMRKDAERARDRDGGDDGPVTAEIVRRLEEASARYARFTAKDAAEDAAERARERPREE